MEYIVQPEDDIITDASTNMSLIVSIEFICLNKGKFGFLSFTNSSQVMLLLNGK